MLGTFKNPMFCGIQALGTAAEDDPIEDADAEVANPVKSD